MNQLCYVICFDVWFPHKSDLPLKQRKIFHYDGQVSTLQNQHGIQEIVNKQLELPLTIPKISLYPKKNGNIFMYIVELKGSHLF